MPHAMLIAVEFSDDDRRIAMSAIEDVLMLQALWIIQQAGKRQDGLVKLWKLKHRELSGRILSDFKYEPGKRLFVVRAIVRMAAPGYVPIFIVEQTIALASYMQVVLVDQLMGCMDNPQERSLSWVLLLILAMTLVQIVNSQAFRLSNWKKSEISRVASALEFAIFLEPLKSGAGPLRSAHLHKNGSFHPQQLTEAVMRGFSHVSALFTASISALAISRALGLRVAAVPVLVVISTNVFVRLGRLLLDYFTARWFVLQPFDCIEEICAGITSIKLHAWEKKYLDWAKTYCDDDGESEYPPKLRIFRRVVSETLTVIHASVKSIAALAAFMQCDTHAADFSARQIVHIRGQIGILTSHIGLVFGSAIEWRNLRETNRILELSLLAKRNHTLDRVADAEFVASLENCEFSWDAFAPSVLSNVSISIAAGQLVVVYGPVGQGKSSLLHALCGELELVGGYGYTYAGVLAYSAQRPYIMSDTIKENILFGREFDEGWYQKVVWACALDEDINCLSQGDQTLVGGNGISVSGGQRARIALARAVYASRESDLALLDDPLAAVDANVAWLLLDRLLLGPDALLKQKACVLVANSKRIAVFADQVVHVAAGQIAVTKQIPAAYSHNVQDDKQQSDCLSKDTGKETTKAKAEAKKASQSEAPGQQNGSFSHLDAKGAFSYFFRVCGYGTISSSTMLSVLEHVSWVFVQNQHQRVLQQVISTNSGSVALWFFQLDLLASAFRQSLLVIDSAFRAYVTRQYCAPRINTEFFNGILYSPMSFFSQEQRFGQISHGFYNSALSLHVSIPILFKMELEIILNLCSSLWYACKMSPFVAISLIPLGFALRIADQRFRSIHQRLSKEASVIDEGTIHARKKLISAAHTVRVLSSEQYFKQEYLAHMDKDMQKGKTMYGYNVLGESVKHTLSKISVHGALLVLVLVHRGLFCESGASFTKITSAEVPNLLRLADGLVNVISSLVTLPERLVGYTYMINNYRRYAQLDPQKQTVGPCIDTPENWPSQGSIEFSNFSMRYSANKERALDGINLKIRAGEKIGIVGRTGAGKSSLAKALFRLTEADEGKILIDNVDISTVSLHDLRSRLAIIPQEPALFFGSIRDNLDPLRQHTLEEIWSAIIKAQLVDLVNRKEVTEMSTTFREQESEIVSLFGMEQERMRKKAQENNCWRRINLDRNSPVLRSGLGKWIEFEGRNFSIGQRQLVALCRALLKSNRKILVLDEATADVDSDTDKIIHQVIRKEFSNSTVITIAHRINTVIDSDRIVVMDRGRIIEADTPRNLLQRNGAFTKLADGY
ncbi:Canalicular multispecific organic anion transporter 1 [Coemansia sp. RSA 1286]|nr:Canalicular multispecific organic anion transporter 1 [Coemansia sp. RSA 1286]